MSRSFAPRFVCAAVVFLTCAAATSAVPAGAATPQVAASNVAKPNVTPPAETANGGAHGRQEHASHAAPRRIDEINIEGEIAVPQVLFITARDQRRFMDFQHRRYLKTSLQVGRETVIPKWIAVVGKPADVRKETSP